jgi:hypothetical protein
MGFFGFWFTTGALNTFSVIDCGDKIERNDNGLFFAGKKGVREYAFHTPVQRGHLRLTTYDVIGTGGYFSMTF